MQTLLGFDIGGTKCAAIFGKYDGNGVQMIGKSVIPTDKTESPYSVLERLCALADELMGNDRPDAIGISCGGPLDSKKGIVKCPPNLPMWIDFPICDILSKRYGVSAHLQNDANACALAENKLGAGRNTENMIFLTFGTGMGAGLILNGRLYDGTNGNAGEVGHIRLAETGPVGFGKAGSFEGFCSGSGLARLGAAIAREQIARGVKVSYFDENEADGGVTAKKIAEAAYKGDKTALEVYRICGVHLGKALSVLIDILNPECIVIGSIFARSGDLLIPAMEDEIRREALGVSADICQIVPAALGESIGDYAALMTATL